MGLTKPIRGLIFHPTLPTQQKHAVGIPYVVELTAIQRAHLPLPVVKQAGSSCRAVPETQQAAALPFSTSESKQLPNLKVEVVLMGKSKELIFHPLLHGRR